MSRKKNRRLSSKQSPVCYGQLEKRSLLAGVVYVDLVDQNLTVIGDYQDNAFSIDLNAETTDELVQGQDETTIYFSPAFDDGFDLATLNDLQVYTNSGDDTVTINGEGVVASGQLVVSLAHGDDSLYVVGGRFQQDVSLYAGTNHDSILLSNLDADGVLYVVGNAGTDIVTLNDVSVAGDTIVLGQFGNDTVLVNDSEFDGGFYAEMGDGSDHFKTVNSQYDHDCSIRGRESWDSVTFADSNTFARKPHTVAVEYETADLSFNGTADDGIAQLKTDFFSIGSDLPREIGDALHDEMSSLSAAYDIDFITLEIEISSQLVTVEDPTPSVSVYWDVLAQAAVAATGVGPTIGSRAYAMVHTAMFDAWSAYDSLAISTTLDDDLQRPESENTTDNKVEAMSFAAYRVLDDLFGSREGFLEDAMDELGFDPANTSTDVTTAVGIGNRMAEALLAVRHEDGANQLGDSLSGELGVPYSDTTGYVPVNPVGDPIEIDAWTPEFVPVDGGDNASVQQFLTPQWGQVDSFSLDSYQDVLPVSPEPFLLVEATTDLEARTITLSDGTVLDISRRLIGSVINPAFIAQAEEVVDISANLTDEQKLIAEFWEDGGGTSFPPGTFMTFGQYVSARDNNSVDDDAKMFFALSNAVFDAGVATWGAKVEYDYVRPVRAIRELGELGLIGTFDNRLGEFVIDAWSPNGGTQTILVTEFLTYQSPGGDVSPPFAEYTSGHSAFSAAGATILEMFTGSDDFGASVTVGENESRFEPGLTPTSDITLTWDTFSEAADEAGVSRLYGGIHFTDGDINGRTLGEEVGAAVWEQAQAFINGTANDV